MNLAACKLETCFVDGKKVKDCSSNVITHKLKAVSIMQRGTSRFARVDVSGKVFLKSTMAVQGSLQRWPPFAMLKCKTSCLYRR